MSLNPESAQTSTLYTIETPKRSLFFQWSVLFFLLNIITFLLIGVGSDICLAADYPAETGLNPDGLAEELIVLNHDGKPIHENSSDRPTVLSLELLDSINDTRAEYGMPAFIWSDELYESAYKRITEAAQYYSHTRPSGKKWHTAYEEAGLSGYSFLGENLFKLLGSDNNDTIHEKALESWMESGPHKANILSSNLMIAIACVEIEPPTEPYCNEYIIVASFMTPKIEH